MTQQNTGIDYRFLRTHTTSHKPPKQRRIIQGVKCPECSMRMVHQGGCIMCTSCGYSKCN